MLLRGAQRLVRLRLRAAGAARAPRDPPRPRPAQRGPLPRQRLRTRSSHDPGRRAEAAAQSFPPPHRGQGPGRPLLGSPLHRRRATADERRRVVARALGLAVHLGEEPPRQRRARRHLPERRPRFERDDLLCGYPTFLAVKPMQWVNRLPAGLISAAGRGVEVLPGSTRYGSPSFLLKQFFRGAVNPFDVAAQIMMNGLTPDEQASLVGSAVRAANVGGNPYDDVVSTMTWAPTDDPISRLVYHHCKLYLAGQTLVKMDRATMAHGVEARAPFLDPALVALACALPSSVKVRGFTTKAVLKRALQGRLPDQILTRRKQGFGVPIAQWFRGPLRPLLEP